MDRRFVSCLLHVLGLSLYFFIVVLILRPQWVTDIAGSGGYLPICLQLSAVILFTLVCTRTLGLVVGAEKSAALWGVLEMLAVAFALTLSNESLSYVVVLSYVFVILGLPYLTISMEKRLRKTEKVNAELREGDKMRFYDDKGRLKIVLSADSVIYIQAADNDIRIHYIDGSSKRVHTLRNTMGAIDDICQCHGILRTHRSYFVNSKHVSWLGRNEKDEVYAILDIPDMPDIPVTKRYYGRIAEKIS